jgi:hypothetical protein
MTKFQFIFQNKGVAQASRLLFRASRPKPIAGGHFPSIDAQNLSDARRRNSA